MTEQPEPAVIHNDPEPAATVATDRVTNLYESWLAAGPPPLGVPIARWWDRRLVELRDAIQATATEATDRSDLALSLYYAQDALDFVAERCDLADQQQRPVTTTEVRQWLKGARCARQHAAEQAERTTGNNPPTSELADRIRANIESEVYEYRERAMWWPETGGVTEEIARLATRGALEALGQTARQSP